MQTIDDFKRIAEVEFADIVKGTYRIDYKLRIALIDNSFIEVHLSLLRKYSNRFCKNPKMRSDESPQCVIHIFHAATRRIHNTLFPYAAIGSVIAFPLLHNFSRLWVAQISFHS